MATVSAELEAAAFTGAPASETPRALQQFARLGYAVAALAVMFGWILTRSYTLVDPLEGVGYWLGIAGGSLMAVLLLYPVRKRVRLLWKLGATRYWFRMHMIFGVVGPILVLYHCNFRFESINGTVALACTLLVAVSGLVGRYLHAKVYNDLDGHRTSLRQLVERIRVAREEQSTIATFVPQLLERMNAYDSAVLKPPSGFVASLLLPLKLAVTTRIARVRLRYHVRKHLAAQAKKSAIARAERKRLKATTYGFIAEHLRHVRRVAELGSYERLFSVWHVFHLPFFYMLVVTALIHVLAVHMY